MRIALAQIGAGTDPEANLELVADQTARAADAGADLVLFPEATMCRFGVPLAPVAQPLDGPWADAVRDIAERAGVTVVAGMFCPAEDDTDGRLTNTLIASGPGLDAHYHKIHLYDAFGFTESRTVARGFEPVVIDVPSADGAVPVGLTTCYDIRFPELHLELAERGAKLLTVHASWGSGPGKLDQWTLLARARALDTSCLVAAVGQPYPGDELAKKGPTGSGGSLVVSPTGDIVVQAGLDAELLVTDVDLAAVERARETIAVLRNRTTIPRKAQSQG
ncbi:carbon-nitrogen hydrolase family protein [Mycolicibacterium sp. CBMA 226]|uniref:carbon-nitrogen hydrolase family protein n=1 Tax=Mycolicibacterium sp. CBMA 226 TaxID=2606611 RepID=UPI0012DCF6A4|nr:carbon-nitrogen hydrolase family protein [Mycolicibacterium sp. CBMA 226]MUL76690.1 carbon-nitrogen hydrolase family protein [Mycolicibacterium sp. CBMA 226]